MSDSSASFWKSLAIFLFFLLLGVYVLYEWYDDGLYAQLAEKDALIDQTKKQMADAESKRLASEEGQAAIRAEIDRLKQEYDDEKQRLRDAIAAGTHTKADLEQAVATLKEAHAAEMATAQQHTGDVAVERDQLAARLADVETRYADAQTQAATLQADLSQIKQAIADTEAEHQAKIAALEQHLNERVELARTTPMDENLLRTAQEVGILPVVQAFEQECKTAGNALSESKAELEAMQAKYASAQQQLAESQNQLAGLQAELAASQSAAASAATEPKDDGAQNAAVEEVSTLRDRLAAEAKVRDALQRQHEAALTALNETLEQTKSQLQSVKETLAQSQSSTQSAEQEVGARLQAAQARVQTLEANVEETRAQATGVQARLGQEVAALKTQLASLQSQPAPVSDEPAEGQVTDAANSAEAQARIAALESQLKAAREDVDAAQAAKAELARLHALNADFAKLNGTYTDHGMLLRLAETELRFPPGKASLPAGELASLDRIATLLSNHPDLSVRIEGHTDSLGGDALNLKLSEARAQAVQQALAARGVDAGRLKAEGIGSARPIADNATADGRGKNRRVEVYIVD
ncbi:OmpA family protein [Thiocystis violacea]|uniref:OmpA family protein n=1 Tax=Thiocystis violacea TaxID=13725 RepID=UPI00237C3059|nr:OmpA family protein [Thiocystis violacea]MBK1721502.1 hypothetical protein [Thiocystis violacea]